MTVLAFLLFVAAVVVMVLVHRQTQRRLADRLVKREEELNDLMRRRAEAMDKQAKVFVRNLARTERAANRMIDEAHGLHQSVRLAMRDPSVKRSVNERESRGR